MKSWRGEPDNEAGENRNRNGERDDDLWADVFC